MSGNERRQVWQGQRGKMDAEAQRIASFVATEKTSFSPKSNGEPSEALKQGLVVASQRDYWMHDSPSLEIQA